MNAVFSENTYYEYLVKGNLPEAIDYVKQFPEQAKRYHRFLEVSPFCQNTAAALESQK